MAPEIGLVANISLADADAPRLASRQRYPEPRSKPPQLTQIRTLLVARTLPAQLFDATRPARRSSSTGRLARLAGVCSPWAVTVGSVVNRRAPHAPARSAATATRIHVLATTFEASKLSVCPQPPTPTPQERRESERVYLRGTLTHTRAQVRYVYQRYLGTLLA